MPSNRVDQISFPLAIQNHAQRLKVLELYVGIWHYVLPVAPAMGPSWAADDPLAVAWQNSCGNVAGQQPMRYRIHPATKIEIQGAVYGFDMGDLPVIMFTLPNAQFFPPNPVPCSFTSPDQLAIWTGLIDTSGNVWLSAQVVAPP